MRDKPIEPRIVTVVLTPKRDRWRTRAVKGWARISAPSQSALDLVQWLENPARGLIIHEGRGSKNNRRVRLNMRHPLALPICLILVVLSPLLLSLAMVVWAVNFIKWRSQAKQRMPN